MSIINIQDSNPLTPQSYRKLSLLINASAKAIANDMAVTKFPAVLV